MKSNKEHQEDLEKGQMFQIDLKTQLSILMRITNHQCHH